MRPNRRQRLAGARAKGAGHSTERADHVLFAGDLRLLRVEELSRPAIGSPQSQDILTANTGNRSVKNRCATASLTDLQRDLRGQFRIGRLAHQRERLANALIGKHAQERRLLKLDGQALPEGVVEHRIARRIGEVAQDDRVGLGQLRCRPGPEVVAGGAKHQDCRRGDEPDHGLRSARRLRLRFRHRADRPARALAALQTLQIGTQLRRVLVAKLAILLQRLEDDVFELFGKLGSNRAWRQRLVVEDRRRLEGSGRAGKRGASRRDLVQDQAERKQIRADVDVFAAQLLGRHVGNRSNRRARGRHHVTGHRRLQRRGRAIAGS